MEAFIKYLEFGFVVFDVDYLTGAYQSYVCG